MARIAWAEDLQAPMGDSRSDSLIKLSNLRSLPIETLDKPSSRIMASSSLRIGSTYSGRVAMSYKIFVNA